MGLLNIEIYCGKLSFDTLGCNKALAFFEVAFIPIIRVLNFIVGKEVQDSG
jgi:hypothetical protein